MAEYYTILTNAGIAYENDRKVKGLPIKLARMSVGDGNGAVYNPDATATALKREVWRGDINSILQDIDNPSWLVLELTLPDDVGGFYVREAGVWTDTGVLYAILKYPESYKPILGSSGSGKEFYLKAIFQTSNAANVVLQVDETIVKATRTWVIDYVKQELSKLDSKQSVRAATTANIALSGTQTVDGVVLVVGDRVLVKNQAVASQNGIYVVATGAWPRAVDANTSEKVTPQLTVGVEQGTANSDSFWFIQTDAPITLGTTALSFEMAYGRTGVAAGSYQKVTVDKQGRVTAGSNPNTLAGFGIIDAFTKTETAKAVSDAVAALVGSAPAALDQLNELAAAIGNDPNFSATLMAELAKKANSANPLLTGAVGVPTRATSDRSANAASTQFVANLLASLGLGTSDLADLPAGTDCNAVKEGGSYQVGSAVNAPPGYPTGIISVVGTNAVNWCQQLFFPQGQTKMFHRSSNGSADGFTDWEERVGLKQLQDAILQSSRGFRSYVIGMSVDTAMTVGQTGNSVQFNANSLTITLPPAAASGLGASLMFRNPRASTQILKAVSGNTLVEEGSSNASLTLKDYEWIELATSGNQWFVVARGSLRTYVATQARSYISGVVNITGDTSLTPDGSGQAYRVTTAGVTLTLPAPTQTGNGYAYTIRNESSGAIVLVTPSGNIYSGNGLTASSITLGKDESVEIQVSGTNWVVNGRCLLSPPVTPAMVNGVLKKTLSGSASVTLTAEEAANAALLFSGTLTANVTVIVPVANNAWTVFNRTTGGYSITLKSASGAGFTLRADTQTTLVQIDSNMYSDMTAMSSMSIDGEIVSYSTNQLRMTNGNMSSFFRIDSNNLYILLTDPGDPRGSFNALRPFRIDLTTGRVYLSSGAETVTMPVGTETSDLATCKFVAAAAAIAAPPGKVGLFASATPPAGWLKCNGAAVSRTVYAKLFKEIGTYHGAGDGSTTFNLPDDRGLFYRAWSDGRDIDSGRELGSQQDGQLESHTHTGTANSGGAHSHTMTFPRDLVDGSLSNDAVFGDQIEEGTQTLTTSTSGTHTHSLTINPTGGNETRPVNRAYMSCIKY